MHEAACLHRFLDQQVVIYGRQLHCTASDIHLALALVDGKVAQEIGLRQLSSVEMPPAAQGLSNPCH